MTEKTTVTATKEDAGSESGHKQLLESTLLLNFPHAAIQRLIEERDWRQLDEFHRIGAAYRFVRDEIKFGYNLRGDSPAASEVLEEGVGQCNTKCTLLMALLRALKFPCRWHGLTVSKTLQKGALVGLAYWLAPRDLHHAWVEVFYDSRWVKLEGVILDKPYLEAVKQMNVGSKGQFCGFAIATKNIDTLSVDWRGKETCIQSEAVTADLGVFTSPDEFFAKHGTNLNGIKKFLYKRVFAPRMNARIQRIRVGLCDKESL